MKQNETVNWGSNPRMKKAETLENSRNFDLINQRALEDSNPRPFGP